jgi:radical SAM superfamily enzyme YgiQ (UPF0313 family)
MNRKLDILFVHANAAKVIYQDLSNDHSAIEPPIWAAMLANSVRTVGFGAAILDAEAERLDTAETVKRITDVSPRVVCFVVYGQQPSASSQNMSGAVLTANLLKQSDPSCFVLFVGGHVAALPLETLTTEPSVDAVCLNEGVYAIRSLLQTKNLKDETSLQKILGIGYKNSSGTAVLNNPERIVPRSSLHVDLPGMAWDLLPDISKYRTAGWHSWTNKSQKAPFASLYTSLGCPYSCSFCMINIINRTKNGEDISSSDSNIFRYWDPEFIIQQFDHIARLGIKNVKIADELFVLNPRHFERICDLIVERGYDFNIWAYSRIDTCKPQYLEKLKRAGVNWLGLGIENPSTVLRKEIHKDGFKEVRIFDVMNSMREAGISIGANYIFGLPMDTHESMQETLDFAMSNLTEMVNVYSAMAYPGSPLHVSARKRGVGLPDRYEGYSQHSYWTLNLSNENLTAAEILRFRDEAWLKYHKHEPYLKMLEDKFGIEARNNVESTTKISLKRKLLGDQE